MALGAGAGPPHQQPPPAKETPVVITAKPPTTNSRVSCLLSRIENLLFFVVAVRLPPSIWLAKIGRETASRRSNFF
jgi:hypothetical protein